MLGTEFKTSVEHAALVNGILGHGDEIDEVLELFGHTSAVLVPAVLAVAEREHCSGEDLIVALVAGYDVASRLAIAGFSLDTLGPRNFQQASTAGSVASAAAAASCCVSISARCRPPSASPPNRPVAFRRCGRRTAT